MNPNPNPNPIYPGVQHKVIPQAGSSGNTVRSPPGLEGAGVVPGVDPGAVTPPDSGTGPTSLVSGRAGFAALVSCSPRHHKPAHGCAAAPSGLRLGGGPGRITWPSSSAGQYTGWDCMVRVIWRLMGK